jgi:hypothetical protein
MLDKHKLFTDVFAPTADDIVLVLVDTPHGTIEDKPGWQQRRRMAETWHQAFAEYPLTTLPLLTYPATGKNNGDLPMTGEQNGQTLPLQAALARASLLVAMTEFSATAPLSKWVAQHPTARAASMPGVLPRMEETALAADYAEVARRTHLLADLLTQADTAIVVFSGGDTLHFDLRYRYGLADDGQCHPGQSKRLINLPSGEAFIVPYEGEREGVPSLTSGVIPMKRKGERFRLHVEANRIQRVEGDGAEARAFAAYLQQDPARANVAELGLGCNDRAVVQGVILEDEKAGMHWAYGRSEHLGGVLGPDAFTSPEHVVHQDVVYAPESEIGVARLALHFPDAASVDIIRDNQYCVF